MALDDTAHEEIDKWIKDNGAFAKKGQASPTRC